MPRIAHTGFLFFALALLICSTCSMALAGGSFSFEADLLPILKQQPVIARWLTGNLDFDNSGDALRIGDNVMPQFGGRRVGPYVILAKPKGASGPFTMEVTVETDTICKDESGKVIDCAKARTMEEKFCSITVKPCK